MYTVQKKIHDFAKKFMPDSVQYRGIILPAKHFRLCGLEFRDDAYYLASAEAEAERLVQAFGLTLDSRVLDVGCGMGRLPTGILSRVGEIQGYTGIDVMERAIHWCKRNIGQHHPTFNFIHVNASNQLYNPNGQSINTDFRLPLEDESVDIIYLYSVFSHMTADHVQVYLKEFRRLLVSSGGIFLTTFIEENVPNVTVNPQNYRMKWTQPLHCVRYNKAYFESLLAAHDLIIKRFDYEKEADGQSGLYIFRT